MTRIVYLGTIVLSNRKPGQRWIAEEVLNRTESNRVNEASSAFSKKGSPIVGGIYESEVTMDGDQLTQITRAMTYRGRSEHPYVRVAELAEAAAEDNARAKRSEAKAKANPAIMAELSNTAAWVRSLPAMHRRAALSGIVSILSDEVYRIGGK